MRGRAHHYYDDNNNNMGHPRGNDIIMRYS